MSLRGEAGGETLNKEMVGAILLGFIMTAIALVVVTIITLIFVFRIVMLWFLVLLSPVAFMGSVLPAFQRYANQWWEKFTSQVIVGPVLAFFLWLSFSMVSSNFQGNIYGSSTAGYLEDKFAVVGASAGTGLTAAISEAGRPENLLNFIIGIAMLMGSLMVAQQMGVAGGKMAGSALGKIQAIASGAAKMPFKAVGKTAKFIASEGVRELEASTGIPLTKTRWKKILDRRKELSEIRRETEFASRKETGVLSLLPKGTDEWAHVLHLKEGPKAFGRFVQGLTGQADRLREEEAGLVGEDEQVDAGLNSKTSQSLIKEQEKNIATKEEGQRQLETDNDVFNKSGSRVIDLNNVDEYLKNLEEQIKKWKEKNEDDPRIEAAIDFAENLEELANRSRKDGRHSVDLNDISSDIDRLSYQQDVSKWFAKRVKTGKNEIKQTKKEWETKKASYEFTKEDQQEINGKMQNLTAKIEELDLGDEAKKALKDKINSLTEDLAIPFEQLTPEKRNEIADKVWDIQSSLSTETENLKKSGKIDNQKAEEITKPAQEIHSLLSKEIVDDEEMKNITEQKKARKERIYELHTRAEMIQPRTMTPEQKKAIHRGVMDEYEKVKEIDDPQELITLYRRAEKEKNTSLARAVLMKLNSQNDMNEVLDDLGLEQSFRGEADLAKRLHVKLGMEQQEAFMFINDLGYKNKASGAFRFQAPVIRDKKTGLYRATTDKEHQEIIMIDSGKTDPESFYRRGWWGGLFCKRTDPVTGARIPIADSTTMAMISRDVEMIHKELTRNFRLQKEVERDMAHPDIINAMRQMMSTLPKAHQPKLADIIRNLETKQAGFWS